VSGHAERAQRAQGFARQTPDMPQAISESIVMPGETSFVTMPLTGTSLHPNWYVPERLRQRFAWLEGAARTARIHDDVHADRLARRFAAEAVTLGRDIFFRANKFDVSSSRGMALLAHELAHVAQRAPTARESEAQLEGEARLTEREVYRTLAKRPAVQSPWSSVPALPVPLTLRHVGPTVRADATTSAADTHRAASPESIPRTIPMKADETRPETADDGAGPQASWDANALAQHAYRMLERKLRIDRERLGLGRQ
jgi:hypothetical protein